MLIITLCVIMLKKNYKFLKNIVCNHFSTNEIQTQIMCNHIVELQTQIQIV